MITAEMKSAILAKVTEDGPVTFVELETIPGTEGDRALAVYNNVYFWDGLSKEAAQAIIELRDEGKIFYYQVDPVFYLSQGAGLELPVAQSMNQLKTRSKKPYWLPIALTTRNPFAA